jgi:branched-subunit amino acid ABC-type transport system permease component
VVGAIVGGMVLGFIFAGFQQLAPQWSNIVLFGSVAIVILTRPEGIFGSTEVST